MERPAWSWGPQQLGRAIGIEIPFTEADAGHSFRWQVRYIADDGDAGPWSEPARFRIMPDDLPRTSQWVSVGPHLEPPHQRPVQAGIDPDALGSGVGDLTPTTFFRRTFDLDRAPASAVVYATALGTYRLAVNGVLVGDQHLAPGWTDYQHRVQVQALDVTSYLRSGSNMIEASLANGWYAGYVGFDPRRSGAIYGFVPRFLARLDVWSGGSWRRIGTDEQWECARGRVRWADIQMGESWDLRRGHEGAFGADGRWGPVRTSPVREHLVAQRDAGISVAETRSLDLVGQNDEGDWILDTGQNLTGWVALDLPALPSGTSVTIRHAEALEDGRLYRAALRTASQTDAVTSAGDAARFEPENTTHGFRYVGISGLERAPAPGSVNAKVAHAAVERTGWFECSDPQLQRTYEAVVWTVRSNLQSVPSDCPQRDERLGWLGDAGAIAPFAAMTFDAAAFYRKWLRDILDTQDEDGMFADTAPRIGFVSGRAGAPGYADVGVLLPALLLRLYADVPSVMEAYEPAKRFLAQIQLDSDDGHRTRGLGAAYGDWLALGPQAAPEAVATAYAWRSADAMSGMAHAVGRPDDARNYRRQADDAKRAFGRHYVTSDGTVADGSISAYALGLGLGLVPSDLRPLAMERFRDSITAAEGHLATGVLCTPLAWELVGSCLEPEVATTAARSTDYPSLGYMLANGATTIWERWDSWTEEAGFCTPLMNSLNHCALGSMAEWFYRYVAGIRVDHDAVGADRVVFGPRIGGGLTHASARLDTVRGRLGAEWHISAGVVELHCEVPPGTSAELRVPATASEVTFSGTAKRRDMERVDADAVVVTIGPGEAGARWPLAAPRLDR